MTDTTLSMVYGKTKLYGELTCGSICPRHYIVRTSWLFGHTPNNYIARILAAADDNSIAMADDQLEAPTYSVHLAQAITLLTATGCYGIYHVSGGAGVTRVEFAREVLAEQKRSQTIQTLSANEAKKMRKATRPKRVVLNCRLYELTVGEKLPSWQQGIREYFTRENSAQV